MSADELYRISARNAAVVVRRNLSPRYLRLDRLEQYVEGTQYDGRPNWFQEGDDTVPLRERKPCVQYGLVSEAIESNGDLCFGEGKFPTITVSDDESTDEYAGDEDEEEDAEGKAVDSCNKWIDSLVKTARLRPAFRLAFEHSQGCGTTVLINGWRAKPFCDVEKAKWCTPTFASDQRTVTKLEIRYPFTREEQTERGAWEVRAYIYRRVIDNQRDVTYKPVRAPDNGEPLVESAWVEEETQTFEHGFGICPVVWYPFMAGCTTFEKVDGRAIHARHTDEIEDLDMALSQRHRAAFYMGDPQLVGYNIDEAPGGMGRTLELKRLQAKDPHFIPADGDPLQTPPPGYRERRSSALKKGVSEFWKVDGPYNESRVEMLTLPSGALDAIDNDAKDLRNKLCEMLAVVFSDPESLKFASAMSGKAQQALRQRQFDRCGKYREDLADNMIIPVVQMHIAIAQNLLARGGQHKLVQSVECFNAVDDIELDLAWGAFSSSDPSEELDEAKVITEVEKSLPLPDEVKAQKLHRILGAKSAASLASSIKLEREKRSDRAANQMTQQAAALHNMAKADAVGTRDRGTPGENKAQDTRGRGNIAPSTEARDEDRDRNRQRRRRGPRT
jgi:hypothetical protein